MTMVMNDPDAAVKVFEARVLRAAAQTGRSGDEVFWETIDDFLATEVTDAAWRATSVALRAQEPK